MKCLDNEEKSECSQVVKLKLKLICFTFFLGWQFVDFDLCKSLLVTCSFGHQGKNIATHVHSTELKLDSVPPQKVVSMKSFNMASRNPEGVSRPRCAICAHAHQ